MIEPGSEKPDRPRVPLVRGGLYEPDHVTVQAFVELLQVT